MEDRNTAMIVLLLLCVTAEMQVDGLSLDVCASCHPKATCDDKSDGSGKVCNCKYGFVGNGRTYCQDKDECQIGASKICGLHTDCHNTQGSYFCTCRSGFTPSNNMDVFTPNDGTHCRDIDECTGTVTGLCGEGGQCRNLEGSFDCSCILGYEVQNGAEPFHPHRDKASCKVVDCGPPEAAEDTVLLSVSGTTYGSAAMFVCEEGFVWRRGNNRSMCEADGLWRGGNMSCEEVNCGPPPAAPHSLRLWDQSSRPGSGAIYQCNSGYHNVGKGNVSKCNAAGEWERPPLLCKDIDECTVTGVCGEGGQCRNLEGSFDCRCILGYEVQNAAEPFHPHRDKASCKVVDCGRPEAAEDTVLLSVSGTTYGSAAMFVCEEGFVWRRGNNRSVCEADGLWRGGNMSCEEVNCGPPPAAPHSLRLWDQSSRPGSRAIYQCNSGYHNVGKGNVSKCNAAGEWERPPLLCKDIDECTVTGLCGEGGQCRNLEGSFDCRCILGYEVQNGAEPFHPHRDKASCKVVDCGRPEAAEDTVLLSVSGTTYGSVAMFVCEEGFVWRRGNNRSVCEADGLWRGGNMSCEEVNCGPPPAAPHSLRLWDQSSRPGSRAIYQCNSGYHNVGKGNVSKCNAAGEWERPPLLCKEILCGSPPIIESTVQVWDGSSAPSSRVLFVCREGFKITGGDNSSICGEHGQWSSPTLTCQEISCGDPPSLPLTERLWRGSSTRGSTATYVCKTGFNHKEGNNISLCTSHGDWTKPNISCKAKCGLAPVLDHSEVVWHNRSVVVHRCEEGYHSWRGSNVSECDPSGEWRSATLTCIEIKPPVNHLRVLKENCVQWRAEKYEEDTETYKVTYTGSRDYQRSFQDKRKRFLSSKADELQLCLNLLPVTNYSISITAASSRFTASITTNTSLTVLPALAVDYREFETPVPTLRLRRSPNTLDPISVYQVFVLPVDGIMMFDCSSPASSDPKSKSSAEYITGQFDVQHVGTEMNFTVGDGLLYGGFFNAPLQSGRSYYIILRAVSQWKSAFKSSCVVWARVTGTSYVLRVSSLSAVAAVGLVAFVIIGGYSFCWFFKRT
ncbi:sushi domain-containing protein 1 isoform X7 [Trematomus bernacchii]|uniref:sushi domain-containing protein 1 isoform X7 n=1 Tax=Trematomus bernacchii TaxID=40690 RepID=UPI00146A752D|nr:sushi domain-containing protein 1 isoform X7 [Trematomus bernacchii]